MHFLLKKAVERMLVGSGLPRLTLGRHRGATLVLAYHNVVPAGDHAFGDRSLHLSQQTFAQQLDVLVETCEVAALEDVLEAAPTRDRPRIVLTFDDAYQGALTAGVEELVARGLPATVFVTPAFVGGKSFWWDDFAAARGGELGAAFRNYALDQLAGCDADIRRWAAQEAINTGTIAWHEHAASEAQLQAALAKSEVSLASHTWSHPNLARLHGSELDAELETSWAWLRERFARVLPWISYPYGRHSRDTEAAAARNGYAGALLIDGGWVGKTIERYSIPRLNVPAGISADGFRLRVSGLLH
jgi:peptidoglycan/xylan/chitin deacetylase (PgdA/CDA1 family)